MLLPGQNKGSDKFRSLIKKAFCDVNAKERGHSGIRNGDTPPTEECPQRIMSPTNVLDEKGEFLVLLAGLKDLALEAATLSGYRVINADNRRVSTAAGQAAGKVIYFSIVADNVMIRRHLGAGGSAVFIREGQILAATGGRAKSIAAVNLVGKRLSGSIELEDALAAAAGLLALGIHPGELSRERCIEEKSVITSENEALRR